VDERTAGWLRAEHGIYTAVHGAFMAGFLGFEDGARPLLVLEDLSAARWVPPWQPGDVDAVVAAMAAIAATPPPVGLPTLRDRVVIGAAGWPGVAKDPGPFLSLGHCTHAWLDTALPRLIEAAAAAPFEGDHLVHLDLRSDNLCMAPHGAVIFDWNMASVGNPRADIAFWLPSLHAEGGPPPEALLPHEPELAAWVCGYFAANAGLPTIPEAPRVRQIQRVQLGTAFPWAVRALGLPTPWIT
jgi:hypothetical protein